MTETGHDSERDLRARFREGDRDAFTTIYRAHSPALFRFALHMTGDPASAAETVQDVFVWLIHNPDKFDPSRGGMAAFLVGVARKFLLRRRHEERRWVSIDEVSEMELPGGRQEPPRANENQAAQLRQAILTLPARYREVVVLCDLEGNTYEAAAAVLECAVGTVRSRLHRARELLGRKLQSNRESDRCAV